MVYFCGQCLSCVGLADVTPFHGGLISKCCKEIVYEDPDLETPASDFFYKAEMLAVRDDNRHDAIRDEPGYH